MILKSSFPETGNFFFIFLIQERVLFYIKQNPNWNEILIQIENEISWIHKIK